MADLISSTQLRAVISTRLQAIINSFTSAMYFTGIGVLIGLVLKFRHLPGEHLVFVFSMSVFSFFLLLQIGLSFIYVFSHLKLAFLGAFSSLSVSLGLITLIFLFENWWGSHILLFLTLPLLVLSLVFVLVYFITGQHRHMAHRKFLYYNIVGAYLFLLLLWAIYVVHQQVSPNRKEERNRQQEEAGIKQT
jgi:hypothetical protein